MIIGKLSNNINEPVQFIQGIAQEKTWILVLECNLEPGEYIVFIDVQFQRDLLSFEDPFDKFIFSTYSETEEIFSYFTSEYDKDLLHSLMMSYARKKSLMNNLDTRYALP